MKSKVTKTLAAGYIRMSTDKQEDSPARQRREIEILAERDGYQIVEWYEDHGLTGTKSKNRPEFQRLMSDAKVGKFRAVLVHEHSRFSREDVFEAFAHFKQLRDCGVKLVTSRRGELKMDDLAGMVTTIIEQHGANAEAIKIADRTLSGKEAKVSAGIRFGRAPFGYEREVYDESGHFVRRIGYHERFMVPKGWHSKLVPSSNPAESRAIRYVFESYVAGTSLVEIAEALNSDGLRLRGHQRRGSDKKPSGKFSVADIRRILTNPAYAGVFRFGATPQGAFARHEGDPVTIEEHHPALVSKALFNQATRRLSSLGRSRETKDSGRYLVSGLVVCGHCHRVMYGCTDRKGEQGSFSYYRCLRAQTGERCADSPITRTEPLEEAVVKVLLDTLLKSDFADQLLRVAQEIHDRVEPTQNDETIAELRRKIGIAAENAALAKSPELFASIEARIKRWQEEIEELESGAIEEEPRGLTPVQEEILERLGSVQADNIIAAQRPDLRVAIHSVVQRITLSQEVITEPTERIREFTCRLEWREELPLEPVTFTYRSRLREPGSDRVARFLASNGGKPHTIGEVAEAFGICYRHAQHYVLGAAKQEKIRLLPERSGNRKLYTAAG